MLLAALLFVQAVISVRTELVTVPVTVTGAGGAHVEGLAKDHFRVFEDGRPQAIAVFHHGDVPVTLGLVVDRSGSARTRNGALQGAVSALLQLTRPDDQLFGLGFNDDVSFALGANLPFTADPVRLETGLSAIAAEGRTALYDGVVEGLRHLERAPSGKKVLVVISDGGDNASRETYAGVVALARRSDAVIYAIGLADASKDDRDANPGLLKRLSRDTGGIAYFPRNHADTIAAAQHLARDLRGQYLLGFSPDSPPGDRFRRLTVTVSAPGHGRLKVRARPGYVSQP